MNEREAVEPAVEPAVDQGVEETLILRTKIVGLAVLGHVERPSRTMAAFQALANAATAV